MSRKHFAAAALMLGLAATPAMAQSPAQQGVTGDATASRTMEQNRRVSVGQYPPLGTPAQPQAQGTADAARPAERPVDQGSAAQPAAGKPRAAPALAEGADFGQAPGRRSGQAGRRTGG